MLNARNIIRSILPPLVTQALLRLFNSCKAPAAAKGEDAICLEFAARCKAWTFEGRLKAVWFHICNEFTGKRRGAWGAQRTYMGRFPGLSDYAFLAAEGSAVIEFKYNGNTLGPYQEDFFTWCDHFMVKRAICYSADQAEAKLLEWGLLV